MDIFLPIGKRLKEERLRLHLNQDDFSQEAGITRKTLFGYETGARAPDAGSLSVWAKMGLDVAYVVTGERKQPLSAVLTSEEQVMLNAYRDLSPKEQKQLMVLALTGVDKKNDRKRKAKGDSYSIEGDNNIGNIVGGKKHKISN